MSDYESHSGKVRRLRPMDGEGFEDQCLRIWLDVEGKDRADYCKGELINEFYEKYVCVKREDEEPELWEVFEHEDLGEDEDHFCRITDNIDGSYSFHTRFYNGGTGMNEMLADALEELDPEEPEMEDYSWVKVKKYVDDERLPWEERYARLVRHHEAETRFLINKIKVMTDADK